MDPSAIWLFFPMMGMSIPIFAIWTKHRQKIEEMRLNTGTRRVDDGRLVRHESQIEMLQDRVKVLERIITDRGLNVAAQIEALRDGNEIEELTNQRSKVLR